MTATKRPRDRWLALIVLGWLWWMLLRNLGPEWKANPQYGYGWFMPLLGGYLFFRRWISRPAPDAPSKNWRRLAVPLALALLPVRVVCEANPDWHLVSWALALLVTGLSLTAIYCAGGRAWLRHFAFPVLFILAAVPWPDAAALAVTQGLMRMVASLAADVLNMIGIPAVRNGNLIETAAGSVGVDDACSGIRSMQGMLMAALFLGELKRCKFWQRLALIAAGAALAFFFNVVRASLLAWLSATRGSTALESWHDPAGFLILGVSFVCLLFVARFFSQQTPRIQPGSMPGAHPLSFRAVACLGAWLPATELATEAWYRWHETHAPPAQAWSVSWPRDRQMFGGMEISPRALEILACDDWKAARWIDDDGSRWLFYFLHWSPGTAGARLETRVHNPAVCLPATGFVLESDLGTEPVQVNGIWLALHSYVFSSEGRRFHVFFAVSEDRLRNAHDVLAGEAWGRSRRLQVVLRGERKIGYRVIEAATDVAKEPAEARQGFKKLLGELIHVDTPAMSQQTPVGEP